MKYDIPNIPKLVYAEKEKKIKRYPCHVNRASALGYSVPELSGCLRRGVYERTHWEQKALHDGRVQLIFDEGNHQEKRVYRDLLDAGIEIIEQQTPYSWEQYKITGSIDGKLALQSEAGHTTVAVPVEIKSMHPNIFSIVHEFEDFRKKPWLRSYMVQITLYMLMQNIDVGIFILKNKSSGELKQIICQLDYTLGEWALNAAERINEHIQAGTLPDKIKDIDVCADCPFNLLCQPDINFGIGLKVEDDPDFENKLDRYHAQKQDAKDTEKLYKEQIIPKLKASSDNGALNVMVGKWHITVKPGKSFRPKFEVITG